MVSVFVILLLPDYTVGLCIEKKRRKNQPPSKCFDEMFFNLAPLVSLQLDAIIHPSCTALLNFQINSQTLNILVDNLVVFFAFCILSVRTLPIDGKQI